MKVEAGNAIKQDALVVGVTGHRFLSKKHCVRNGVVEALSRIVAAFPNRSLAALSSLAEGSDQIVAEEALRMPGTELIVPLPFRLSEYAGSFVSDESREGLDRLLPMATEIVVLPEKETRQEAYCALGQYLAESCDVLLAVWDGEPAQGPGGTADVVNHARALGKPLVIVLAGNREPGTNTPATLGNSQGSVVTERFPPI